MLRKRLEVRARAEGSWRWATARMKALRGVTRLVEVGLSSPTCLTSLFANPLSADPVGSAKFRFPKIDTIITSRGSDSDDISSFVYVALAAAS